MMKIKLEPTQRLYFTSDTHYNHTNICRGTTRWTNADDITRDFKTLSEMCSINLFSTLNFIDCCSINI